MDLEELFYMNFGDHSHSWSCSGYDEELINKAETLSEEWTTLFKYSTPDGDVENISRILDNIGFNAEQVNTFTQQNLRRDLASKQQSIAEDHTLILLGKQYFEFEASNCFQTGGQSQSNPNESTMYSTVSDYLHSFNKIDQNRITNEESHIFPEISSKKKRKRKNKNRKQVEHVVDTNIAADTDIPANLLGAPPGVKAVRSQNTKRGIDLTKNSSYSLQFRL